MRVHIGTSGYNYPEWRGTVFPDGLSASKMFAFFAARFYTVEIKYTFFRMPTLKLPSGGRAQAPERFSYTLKAPRNITHDRRLKDCGDAVSMFTDNARALGPHLATLLFQLPPTMKADVPRFDAFLRLLPPDLK